MLSVSSRTTAIFVVALVLLSCQAAHSQIRISTETVLYPDDPTAGMVQAIRVEVPGGTAGVVFHRVGKATVTQVVAGEQGGFLLIGWYSGTLIWREAQFPSNGGDLFFLALDEKGQALGFTTWSEKGDQQPLTAKGTEAGYQVRVRDLRSGDLLELLVDEYGEVVEEPIWPEDRDVEVPAGIIDNTDDDMTEDPEG